MLVKIKKIKNKHYSQWIKHKTFYYDYFTMFLKCNLYPAYNFIMKPNEFQPTQNYSTTTLPVSISEKYLIGWWILNCLQNPVLFWDKWQTNQPLLRHGWSKVILDEFKWENFPERTGRMRSTQRAPCKFGKFSRKPKHN